MEETTGIYFIKDRLEAILLAMNTSKDRTKIAGFLLNEELNTAIDSIRNQTEYRSQIYELLFKIWLYFIYLPSDPEDKKAQTSNELSALIEKLASL